MFCYWGQFIDFPAVTWFSLASLWFKKNLEMNATMTPNALSHNSCQWYTLAAAHRSQGVQNEPPTFL